ncbi:chromate transporter [Aminobacter aminovorans]|uniref:Chromate transporter, chromate ion transporter (CHR) family n=1 Tax=Aminobacter aminovorans TaxID=83263 RepID=A0A380WGE6_AMIAI|nr:chromate transporter [Aminobacter aminovorans]TCS27133.1 chromate transporter [Aminobacter aminovorans]SUU87808.1 chromate transporter, chromate ion transporter (CHR) family [Aminobacter aminovorans]
MTSVPDPAAEPPVLIAVRSAPGLGALFLTCLKIGLMSFGGGLSGWLYQEFVLRNRWISDEDFASSLAISQMLPGANVVNLVICMGDDLRGLAGSIACVLGFLVGPFFAVIALSAVFDALPDVAMLEAASNGVAYAALGLLLVICLKGVQRAMKFPPGLAVIAAVATAVGVLKLPLIPVVFVAAPISVALAWRRS